MKMVKTKFRHTFSSLYCLATEYTVQYSNVIRSAMASQITSLTLVYSTVYSSADQRKHQSSASRTFVSGIHRCLANSPHKGPVTRKMVPFDDVIMLFINWYRRYPRLVYDVYWPESNIWGFEEMLQISILCTKNIKQALYCYMTIRLTNITCPINHTVLLCFCSDVLEESI